jgi:hypothetical protein
MNKDIPTQDLLTVINRDTEGGEWRVHSWFHSHITFLHLEKLVKFLGARTKSIDGGFTKNW